MPAPEGDMRYMGVCGDAGVKGVKGVCGEWGVLQRKEDMLSLTQNVQCKTSVPAALAITLECF